MARLQELFRNKIVPQMIKDFGYSSLMEVAEIKKITLNVAVKSDTDKKTIAAAKEDIRTITGQTPAPTYARKSIAGFKLREGQQIGWMVTLRRQRMYEFLDHLITIALPRVRDFRGLSIKSFDHAGNYSLGLKEQIVFPEIDYDKIDAIRGMDITITIKCKSRKAAAYLLKSFKFPLKEDIETIKD